MVEVLHNQKTTCYHCGDDCLEIPVEFEGFSFCCVGCKNVYAILSNNNLCDYYNLESNPGTAIRNPVSKTKFNYLDDEQVLNKLIDFNDGTIQKVTFFIPIMHCSSCIWLLENLYKLDSGIVSSRVNFLKKNLVLTYKTETTSLRKIVELLSAIGYEPAINLNDVETQVKRSENKKLSYQIGVAGFCFGNIMLISFPEYFGLDEFARIHFSRFFGYLNMILALPVFLFSAQDYFKNAIKGLRNNYIGIDVPLALGIFILFSRSAYEVLSHTGIGYFDTLAGLVFFILIGKWFQQKTFETLSFERDYKSYFPIAVGVIINDTETTMPVNNLKIGDRIIIRNNELIPADSILLKGDAHIDFSFVTGESAPVRKVLGEIIYAGGRQTGETIELEVSKKVSQSYLTQLWNSEHFAKQNESKIQTFQQTVSRYFTFALILIAVTSAIWWLVFDPSLSLNAFTSVLIIACPCALALSSPFALGTSMRILGRNKFYIKSPEVVEQIARTQAIVFDKTGTITQSNEAKIEFVGKPLSEEEIILIASLTKHSVHPLSKKIHSLYYQTQTVHVTNYNEEIGKGLQGLINEKQVKIGSQSFLAIEEEQLISPSTLATKVFVMINNSVLGYFKIEHSYRSGLNELITKLKVQFKLYLLSGDNDSERQNMNEIFGEDAQLFFKQSPMDKLTFVEQLKLQHKSVMMIGDGLNDAGALKASDTGISVSENTSHFSPASDVIMDASVFNKMGRFIQFAKDTKTVIKISFIISLIYNIIGLSFAVQGNLSPLIAAILMPLSSVTVIAFTTAATTLFAKKGGLE
jgi:Cu+-exporting ATPase